MAKDEKPAKFDCSNYSEWESSIMNHLKAKSLWKTIRDRPLELNVISIDKNGAETKETKKSQSYLDRLDEWEDRDMQASGKICERVDTKYVEQLRRYDTAAEVWDAIKNIGQAQSTSNMILIRAEFSETKMEEGSVLEHIGRLERCLRLLKETEAPVMDGELIITLMGSLRRNYLEVLRANPSIL